MSRETLHGSFENDVGILRRRLRLRLHQTEIAILAQI